MESHYQLYGILSKAQISLSIYFHLLITLVLEMKPDELTFSGFVSQAFPKLPDSDSLEAKKRSIMMSAGSLNLEGNIQKFR